MPPLTLTPGGLRDRILGGWLGKSAGLTLGSQQQGRLIPGAFTYYNPVPGQPAAAAAVDFELVSLGVLERTGADITSEDLAVARLEHLDYSEDELGYAALNLRRGLPPPSSGAHSNWFRNATCALGRADIWALVAPGAPQVAAQLAYRDASLDHAEDGLWSAMFCAAMESAAFFLSDPLTLLTVGLAMIPKTCRCARAVKCALAAGQRGASWLEVRESVIREVGSDNVTDAPQNLGFFAIGMLYGGRDFGQSICAAANCGYDAETVGGMVGATLGIAGGGDAVPARWSQPLGDAVVPGLGLRDFEYPTTLTELADRTVAVCLRIIGARVPQVEITEKGPVTGAETAPAPVAAGADGTEPPQPTPPSGPDQAAEPVSAQATESGPPPETPAPETELPTPSTGGSGEAVLAPQPVAEGTSAPAESTGDAAASTQPAPAPGPPDPTGAIAWADSTLVRPLLVVPPNSMATVSGAFEFALDPGDSPAISYGEQKSLGVTVRNRGETRFTGRVSVLAPAGWQIKPPPQAGQRQNIAAGSGAFQAAFGVRVPEAGARIEIANAITIRLDPDDGSAAVQAEFVLLGAGCWWTVGPFANFDGEGFDRVYGPEDRPGLTETYVTRMLQSGRWEKRAYPENVMDLEPAFKNSSGVCYAQTKLRCPADRQARIAVHTNNGVKLWLNGSQVFRLLDRKPFRPLIGSGPWIVDVDLRAGDNLVLVKCVRGSEPYRFSFTVSDRQGRGIPDIGNTEW